MLKQSIPAIESWSNDVGEVQAASSRSLSGSGGASGSRRICGNDGGVWKTAAVWKSTLRDESVIGSSYIIKVTYCPPYDSSYQAVVVSEGEEPTSGTDHTPQCSNVKLSCIVRA